MANPIQSVGVGGAGVMGHGIALVAAQAGFPTTLYDPFPQALDKARTQLEAFTAKSVEKGKLSPQDREAALQRLTFTDDLDQLVGDLVVEAIPERADLKHTFFQALEANNAPDAILATNTSSMSVTALAGKLKRPERFVGLHFFNPAPIMKLVEVVTTRLTDAQVLAASLAWCKAIGKTAAQVQDTPGFIVNRVARFYYLESLRILEEQPELGHEALDEILEGSGFRMGPFRLMDLIGIDTNHLVTQTVYAGFFQANRFRPSRLQQQMVDAGRYGRKNGAGFYSYTDEGR